MPDAAVLGHAPVAEELHLEVEDAPDVGLRQGRGDQVVEVSDDPLVRVVWIEDRVGRLRR